MLEAFRTEGVILPLTSREQAKVGQPVTRTELLPGDLIFYYHPVSHVAMYLGDGRIVHAARPGVGVVTARLTEMGADIVAIRRITSTVET
jgi:cell wall-associated NlpC family hydrolase